MTILNLGGFSSGGGSIPDFGGDTGSGGTAGLVPAPPAGSCAAGYVLSACGTWAAGGGGSSGWSLTGNSLSTTGKFGSISAQAIDFIVDNVQWLAVGVGKIVAFTTSSFSVAATGGISLSNSGISPISITNPGGDLDLEGVVIGLGDDTFCHFINIGNNTFPSITTIAGSIIAPDLTNVTQTNVVSYDSGTGDVTYTPVATILSTAWLLAGNASPLSGSFLGTTTSDPLLLKVNNTTALNIGTSLTWTVTAGIFNANCSSNFAVLSSAGNISLVASAGSVNLQTTSSTQNITINAGQNLLANIGNALVINTVGSIHISSSGVGSDFLLACGSGGFNIDAPSSIVQINTSTISVTVGALNYQIFTSDADSNITIGQNSAITNNTIGIGLPDSATTLNGSLTLVNTTNVIQTNILAYNSTSGLVTYTPVSTLLSNAWLTAGNSGLSVDGIFGTLATTTHSIISKTNGVTYQTITSANAWTENSASWAHTSAASINLTGNSSVNLNAFTSINITCVNSVIINADGFSLTTGVSVLTLTVDALQNWDVVANNFDLTIGSGATLAITGLTNTPPTGSKPVMIDPATNILYISP